MNFLKSCCYSTSAISATSTVLEVEIGEHIRWEDTIEYMPPVTNGIVIKVYDGDTITIATNIHNDKQLYRFSVRLAGIDCAEINSKDKDMHMLAEKAKNKLSNLILNKRVYLKNIKKEKFGRLLADVYLDDLCLNQYMLDNKLAVVYNGENKNKIQDKLHDLI
jgi:endonuclease YncB( thermonuclease family)